MKAKLILSMVGAVVGTVIFGSSEVRAGHDHGARCRRDRSCTNIVVLERELCDLRKRLEAARHDVAEYSGVRESIAIEIADLRMKLGELVRSRERVGEQRRCAQDRVDRQMARLATLEPRLVQFEEELACLVRNAPRRRVGNRVVMLGDPRAQAMRRSVRRTRREIEDTRRDIRRAERTVQLLCDESKAIHCEIDRCQREADARCAERRRIEDEMAGASARVCKIEKRIQCVEEELAVARAWRPAPCPPPRSVACPKTPRPVCRDDRRAIPPPAIEWPSHRRGGDRGRSCGSDGRRRLPPRGGWGQGPSRRDDVHVPSHGGRRDDDRVRGRDRGRPESDRRERPEAGGRDRPRDRDHDHPREGGRDRLREGGREARSTSTSRTRPTMRHLGVRPMSELARVFRLRVR